MDETTPAPDEGMTPDQRIAACGAEFDAMLKRYRCGFVFEWTGPTTEPPKQKIRFGALPPEKAPGP